MIANRRAWQWPRWTGASREPLDRLRSRRRNGWGAAQGDWTATGVSIDTRTLCAGDLFIALKAARDGHQFVAQALENGASAAMVTHIPDGVSPDAPLLIVEDVQAALEALGRAGRARSQAKVVGITGSVGKTSTKDMMRHVLASQGATHAAEASYNNHWGVPLTLARLPREARFAVIEIGMNHPGEIAPLTRMARPHVAIVTTVAAAHLEAFDSIDGIAHEKASIFEGLEPGGVAIFNADVPTSPILRAKAEACSAKQISFGVSAGSDYQLLSTELHEAVTVGHARLGQTPVVFKVGVAGRHFALNAMAVLATLNDLDVDLAVGISDLSRWRPISGRGTRERLQLDPVDDAQTFDLIDDAFNANPASMAASLDMLANAQPVDGVGRIARGRRIAVLGDMLELGDDEMALHAALAELPHMRDVHEVHCVGPRMKALYDVLPLEKRGQRVDRAEELAQGARRLVDPGDVILVKGSKGSRVSLVVDALRKVAARVSNEEEDD